MARRMTKKEFEGVSYLVLIVVFLVSVVFLATVATMMLPVVWLFFEFFRLAYWRPKGGFRLSEHEFSKASKLKESWELANELFLETIQSAITEGCKQRSDGLFDERKPFARQVNPIIVRTVQEKLSLEQQYVSLMNRPFNRFQHWATVVKYSWAFRFFIFLQFGLYFSSSPNSSLPSLLFTSSGFSEFLSFGFVALIPGAVVGAIGFLIGSWRTETFRPSSFAELMEVAKSEFIDSTIPTQEESGNTFALVLGLFIAMGCLFGPYFYALKQLGIS